MTQSYTAVGLQEGTTYKFKVLSRNSYGDSAATAPLEILAAQIPDKPDPAVTAVDGTDVDITWTAPGSGGSEILGYRVYIRTYDLTSYTLDLDNCNGADE